MTWPRHRPLTRNCRLEKLEPTRESASCRQDDWYKDVLASHKKNDGESGFDDAGYEESAWSDHTPIRRAYLFNVIIIKSPRSGPQYIASCSPPRSKIFSRGAIERKATGRRYCKVNAQRDGKGYDIHVKVCPCGHPLKWDTQAMGMKTSKIFSPALRELSTPEPNAKRSGAKPKKKTDMMRRRWHVHSSAS